MSGFWRATAVGTVLADHAHTDRAGVHTSVIRAVRRAQIRALAQDIPGSRHAHTTVDADREQLIRQLVEQVCIEGWPRYGRKG
ncbi:hypothetical protein [Streptomyces sp. NPDC002845]